MQNINQGGEVLTTHSVPGPLAENLRTEVPEIGYAARVSYAKQQLISVDDKNIYENGVYAEPDYFRIMTFPAVEGDPVAALKETNSIVITQSTAKELFGDKDPLNKIISHNNNQSYKVGAVIEDIPSNSTYMLKNYIKIAWRNIQKNKGVFGLNILGLAIGIAACIMILLFIHDESSYDSYSKNAAQLARVVFNAKVNGEQMKEAVVMAPVAKTLKNDLPEVTDATRLRRIYQAKITNENEVYRDSRFAFVDPNFLELFSLNTLKGKTQNPIGEPNTAVITQSEARRLFGKKNPIGERLKLNDEQDYLITAVIEDVPRNSHFHFDIFASMLGYDLAQNNSWVNSNFFTYILLKKGADIKKVEEKLPAICEKYMGPQMKEAVGMSFAEFTRDNEIGLYLQPLQDIHLHSDFTASTELEQGGNIQYLYIFGAIAIFMIVIACINFMNLSTATATKRAKEVGIRKVLGSKKDQLIFQFLAEAIISSLLALLIAIGLYALCLPVFNHLSGKEFIFGDILHGNFILLLIGLSILIALLSGIYPAVFLSSFNPLPGT